MQRLGHTLAALAAAGLLGACGGSGFAPVTLVAATAAEPPAPIRLEGCVLGLDDRPLALPVFASGADGRLLASAMTDADGVFRMHVPARTALQLAAGSTGAEPLAVLTGSTPLTLTGCLRFGSLA